MCESGIAIFRSKIHHRHRPYPLRKSRLFRERKFGVVWEGKRENLFELFCCVGGFLNVAIGGPRQGFCRNLEGFLKFSWDLDFLGLF